MTKASRDKGKRGERMLRDVWKSHGYEDAHRSGQFSAKGESSADIEGIDPRLHIECKVGYRYQTIYDFLEQAKRDAKEGQIPIVNCKMDRMPWLWVCYLDDGIEMWKERHHVEVKIISMIVHCRDCKNWRESHSEDEESYCYIDGRTTDSTDYCSWGERKNNE